MPSRSDLFAMIEKLLKLSGIVTVWRGSFVPAEYELGADLFPLAGYRDTLDGESIESGNLGFSFKGDVDIDIWVFCDLEGVDALRLNPGPWKILDDLHDAFMDQLSDAYRGELPGGTLTSQVSIFPSEHKAWEPLWWYRESPHKGATLRLHYEINYAPKAH